MSWVGETVTVEINTVRNQGFGSKIIRQNQVERTLKKDRKGLYVMMGRKRMRVEEVVKDSGIFATEIKEEEE